VQEAFGVVILVVMVVAVIAAVASFADRTDLYDQIGRGGLNVRDSDAARTAVVSAPASKAEQEEEIRQMLEARNERRARQGKEPLDVEAKVERQLRDV